MHLFECSRCFCTSSARRSRAILIAPHSVYFHPSDRISSLISSRTNLEVTNCIQSESDRTESAIMTLKVVTVVSSPKNKMNILRVLDLLHRVKRFGKGKSEPVFQVFRKHPITRGMASYFFMWPLGNVIQQTIYDQEKYDWWKIIRFGFYGAFITAPMLFAWVRLSTAMWPNTNFRIACAKVR